MDRVYGIGLPASIVSISLLLAAVGKSLRFDTFQQSLGERVGAGVRSRALSIGVLLLEISIGLSMWTSVRWGGALALLVFLPCASTWVVTGEGVRRDVVLPDCNCFGVGALSSAFGLSTTALRPTWWALRNGALGGLSLAVLWPTVGVARALAVGVATVSFIMLVAMALAVSHLRRVLVASALLLNRASSSVPSQSSPTPWPVEVDRV